MGKYEYYSFCRVCDRYVSSRHYLHDLTRADREHRIVDERYRRRAYAEPTAYYAHKTSFVYSSKKYYSSKEYYSPEEYYSPKEYYVCKEYYTIPREDRPSTRKKSDDVRISIRFT